MAGSETDVPIHQIEDEVEDISPTSTGLDVDVELECQSYVSGEWGVLCFCLVAGTKVFRVPFLFALHVLFFCCPN